MASGRGEKGKDSREVGGERVGEGSEWDTGNYHPQWTLKEIGSPAEVLNF